MSDTTRRSISFSEPVRDRLNEEKGDDETWDECGKRLVEMASDFRELLDAYDLDPDDPDLDPSDLGVGSIDGETTPGVDAPTEPTADVEHASAPAGGEPLTRADAERIASNMADELSERIPERVWERRPRN